MVTSIQLCRVALIWGATRVIPAGIQGGCGAGSCAVIDGITVDQGVGGYRSLHLLNFNSQF